MSLKYRLGSAVGHAIEVGLSSRFFPLTRYFPYGVSWAYDLQRFMGTRAQSVLFDVGANTGQTLERLLRYAPAAEIYSFEPAAGAFQALTARFGGRRNVHLLNLALGSRSETLALQVRADSELNTLVPAAAGDASTVATETAQVSTVDAIAAERALSHIDLLKIDVQGWEMEVMRGAARLIADRNIVFVLAEMAFRSDETEMQQFTELHDHLEGRGFVLSGFYDLLRYGPRKEFVLFGNMLYLHPQARLKWSNLGDEWERWMAVQKPKGSA